MKNLFTLNRKKYIYCISRDYPRWTVLPGSSSPGRVGYSAADPAKKKQKEVEMSRNGVGRPANTPKTGGRKPGIPNKTTASVRAALEEAFDKLGGVPALVAWGKTKPDEFYKIWVKLLPQDINHSGGITAEITVLRVDEDGKPANAGQG
jgi:hypothetical protein